MMSARMRHRPGALLAFGALAVLLLVGACTESPVSAPRAEPGGPPSNIERAAYAGSDACAACHVDLAKRFAESPMHRMTRSTLDAVPAAPFRGERFEHAGDRVVAFREGDRFFMRLSSAKAGEKLFHITKIIGGREREDYVGIEVASTEASPPKPRGAEERVMPVSYLLFNQRYRYKGYSVLVDERPGMVPGASWRETCIFCHNTTPLLTTLYDDLGSRETYQGSATDDLLPPDVNPLWRVRDEPELLARIGSEMAVLGATLPGDDLQAQLDAAASATRQRYGESHLVELGIGCEACHLGSAAHAKDPKEPVDLWPNADFAQLEMRDGEPPSEATRVNRTCLRCHTVLFSKYEHTWEGRRRYGIPGGSNINSGEARNFLLGGCHEQMSCTHCHDPHQKDDATRLAAFDRPEGNGACTECHDAYAGDAQLEAHTRHPADSVGAACAACHMPKKNMSLTYELTRYHRIGSPTEKDRLYGDRPMECALCHTTWSARRIAGELERGWSVAIDENRLAALYPDLDAPVLAQTLTFGKDHEKASAIGALGEHGDIADAPRLVQSLANRYPLIRYYAEHALTQLVGCAPPVDLFGDPSERIRDARAWIARGDDACSPAPAP